MGQLCGVCEFYLNKAVIKKRQPQSLTSASASVKWELLQALAFLAPGSASCEADLGGMHRWALALWLPVGRAGRGEESRVPAASSSSPQGHVERPRPVSSAWPCTQTPRLADSSLLLPSGPGAALAALCALATPAHAWAHSPCIKLSSAVNTSVPVAARTPPTTEQARRSPLAEELQA